MKALLGLGLRVLNSTFNNISIMYMVVVSFIGGGNQSSHRKPYLLLVTETLCFYWLSCLGFDFLAPNQRFLIK